MLNTIIVLLKGTARIIRRVYKDTLNLPGELLLKGFEGEKVIAEDEAVIKKIMVSHAVRCVIGLLRIFEQDARLQPGPVLFANPCEFEFLLLRHALIRSFRLQGRRARRGQTVFLQPAVGFFRDGHLDEAHVQKRLEKLSAKLGAILSPNGGHEFKQGPFFAAEPKNNDLVLT